MKKLLLGTVSILLFSLSNAHSMSCSSWASGNVAAQPQRTLVAKVTTLTLNPKTKASTLKVEKIYKGDLSVKLINLPEDDMGFSVRISPEEGSWIGLFVFNETGQYYNEIGCAENYFKINQNGKIKVNTSEISSIELSEVEFNDYINMKSSPSLRALVCEVSVDTVAGRRVYADRFITLNESETFFEKNLSPTDPQLGVLKINTFINYSSGFSLSIKDPFFGKTISSTSFLIEPGHNSFIDYNLDVFSAEDEKNNIAVRCVGEYTLPMISNDY